MVWLPVSKMVSVVKNQSKTSQVAVSIALGVWARRTIFLPLASLLAATLENFSCFIIFAFLHNLIIFLLHICNNLLRRKKQSYYHLFIQEIVCSVVILLLEAKQSIWNSRVCAVGSTRIPSIPDYPLSDGNMREGTIFFLQLRIFDVITNVYVALSFVQPGPFCILI